MHRRRFLGQLAGASAAVVSPSVRTAEPASVATAGAPAPKSPSILYLRVMPLTVDPPSAGAAQMITPSDLPVQHAKWSPDGARIVFAYVIPGGKPVPTPAGAMVPQGIAIVDVPPGI